MGGMRIAYDYTFTYKGDGTFQGRQVTGASVTLNIRAYKDGREMLFERGRELKAYGFYYNEAYSVYFDTDRLYVAIRNEPVCRLFREKYGWDRIDAQVTGYLLNVEGGAVPMKEEDFLGFLTVFRDDFNSDENKPAWTPNVLFYEPSVAVTTA